MEYRRKLFSPCIWLLGGLLVAFLAGPAWAQAPEAAATSAMAGELGRWVTESGNLEVEITPCGQALCGIVVKVLGNRSMSDPSATMEPVDSRPALGMKILADFVPTGDGEWTGSIYNRENGKTYRCLMTLLETGQLRLRPYLGVPLFGKTQIWRRVSDPGR